MLTACFGFVSCGDDDDVSPQGTGGDRQTDVAVSGDVSSVEVREATIEGFVNALDIQSFTLPVWKARLFGLKSNAFRAEKHSSPSRKAMLSKINLKMIGNRNLENTLSFWASFCIFADKTRLFR